MLPLVVTDTDDARLVHTRRQAAEHGIDRGVHDGQHRGLEPSFPLQVPRPFRPAVIHDAIERWQRLPVAFVGSFLVHLTGRAEMDHLDAGTVAAVRGGQGDEVTSFRQSFRG